MKTKITFLLTVLLVSFTTIQAQYTLQDDDVVVTDGVIQSCSYDFAITDIVIPNTLDGQEVIGVGDDYNNLFYVKAITSVQLPNTIQNIGIWAFKDDKISSLNLSDCTDLRAIGTSAFNNNSIDSIDLSSCNALQIIGNYAFYDNSSVHIDLSSCTALITIKEYAFDNNLFTEFTLPTPDIEGYIFEHWEDGNGNTYTGGGTVTDLETSYTAILTEIVLPTVTTQAATDITGTTASGNGTITILGVPAPTQHGVCWNTTGSPVITDNVTEEGVASATGVFTSEITGLTECTTYYVRAYVTNSEGTAYGDEVSFTTEDVTDPTITCVDNQTVNIAQSETVYTVNGTEFDPTATDDNCAVASVSNDFNSTLSLAGAELPTGTTTIIWTVTDDAGNTATCSFDVIVTQSTGVNEISAKTGFTIHPNPAGTYIIVTNKTLRTVKNIKIMDIAGKVVKQINDKAIGTEIKIQIDDLQKGTYFIKVNNDTVKFVKQ